MNPRVVIAGVDADFFSGAAPVGIYSVPSPEIAAFKKTWSAALQKRWFGL